MTWRPPPPSSIHGEHLGYRISYRRHHGSARRTEEDVRSLRLDESYNRADLKDLEPWTKYLVSVQVVNPKGVGPAASVEVFTDEGGE